MPSWGGEAHVFDAFYPVYGVIDDGGCPGLTPFAGKKVVFYQSYPTYVEDSNIIPGTGEYTINIFDNIEVDIDPNVTYYIAVEKAADGWGADPVEVHITSEGWNKVDLTLALGAGPGGDVEGPDDGLIRNTIIERFGDHVKISWIYNGATNAKIWRMSAGPDGEFSNVASSYDVIDPIQPPLTGTEWEDTSALIGDGNNYYYRVVPGGTNQSEIHLGTNNKKSVGKIDITLNGEGKYSFCSYPFNAAYIDLPTLIGDQLELEDQIHWWDSNAQPSPLYNIITKLAGGWNAVHNFELGEAFLVYLSPQEPARTDVKVTLVGLVNNYTAGVSKPLGLGYNLIGYSHPVIKDAAAAGFTPNADDQIHSWIDTGGGIWAYEFATNISGSGWMGNTTFEVGEGKFYYIPSNRNPYDWTIDFTPNYQ